MYYTLSATITTKYILQTDKKKKKKQIIKFKGVVQYQNMQIKLYVY